MATDYAVIEAVRRHFGDDPTGDIGVKGQDWHGDSNRKPRRSRRPSPPERERPAQAGLSSSGGRI
jgi:hypothetical protein